MILKLVMKPVLVGENNPYGAGPKYALYPYPEQSTGGRLCRLVLGLGTLEYLERFDRANLLQQPKWSAPAAREAALRLRAAAWPGHPVGGAPRRVLVLLGYRVACAFGYSGREAFTVVDEPPAENSFRLVFLPHPSGLSRIWNEPGAFEQAREVLRRAGAL